MSPSLKILKTTYIQADFSASNFKAGLAATIEYDGPELERLYADDIEFTKVDSNKFLGAFSLYKNNQVSISGLSKITKNKFKNSELKIYSNTQYVTTRELKNPSKIRIPTSFFKQIADDEVESQKKFMRSVLKEQTLDPFCYDIQKPIQSKVVSQFGSFRQLPNGQEYFHSGLDLRAPIGKTVYAVSDGRVRVARKLILSGNAVVVEHGHNVFSKYYHLSQIQVEEGKWVKKGDVLGKSGDTGRVEAPHLHWEIAWKGISVDPLEFVSLWKRVCPSASEPHQDLALHDGSK